MKSPVRVCIGLHLVVYSVYMHAQFKGWQDRHCRMYVDPCLYARLALFFWLLLVYQSQVVLTFFPRHARTAQDHLT